MSTIPQSIHELVSVVLGRRRARRVRVRSHGVWQKVKNVRRDPRVCLSTLANQKNPMGLLGYLVVNGTARITEGGAASLLQRLAHVYIGPDVVFPPEPYRNNPGYITRMSAKRFTGVGPWNPAQK